MKKIFNLEAYNKRKMFHEIFAWFIAVAFAAGQYCAEMWIIEFILLGIWFMDALLSGRFSKK